MSGNDLPIIPVGVSDAPFALDLWARDCPPSQFIREFTMNGIEAIESYRTLVDPNYEGEVVWTIDHALLELDGQTKLACVDTGIGMDSIEMPEYLNGLAASGKNQGLDRNFGIGAKVSAAVANPFGVVYASWKSGRGNMVELGRDSNGTWGMRQHRLKSGDVHAVVPVSNDLKPPELDGLDHGTLVTFSGSDASQDTTLPPRGERGERWIAKNLNQRFYEIPEWVTVKAREIKVEGTNRAVRFRTVRGQKYFLDQHTDLQGSVKVAGATVHWRVLSDNHADRVKQGDIWASTGHRACLFQGELFEMATAARGGYEKLKEFGIRFGYERVVLYVEPDTASGSVTQDAVRAQVKIDGQPLPWNSYAADFEDRMPIELRTFQEEIAAGANHRDHSAAIRERLAEIADLFQIPRYRPEPEGSSLADDANVGGNAGSKKLKRASGTERSSGQGGTGGNVYALFEDDGGRPADEVAADALPEINVDWVSVTDGTRAPGYLDDRAAAYDQRRNRLEINADFRGFTDVLMRWDKRYAGVAGASPVVEDIAASWWQQALEESVLGVLALRGSEHWDEQTVADALSEVSLTAASMARYHLDAILRRELANRLGTLRAA